MIRFREIVLGLIGAGLTGVLLWSLPNLVQSWEWKTLDLRFQWRGPVETDANVILIEADDESARTFGRWPWKRTIHAHLIELLSEQKARTVVYDILFALESDSLEDGALKEAVKKAGNVVFPVAVHLLDKRKPFTGDHSGAEMKENGIDAAPAARRYFFVNRAILPFAPLPQFVRLGHIATNRDADGLIRRVPLLVRYHDHLLPSLAFQGVLHYLNVPPQNVLIKPRTIVLKNAQAPGTSVKRDLTIPVDDKGQMLINYAGTWETTFQHASLARVLDRPEAGEPVEGPSTSLENKFVLVANTISGYDAKPVPIEKDFPGAGVHANIVNTLLTGNFLRETSTTFNVILVVLLCIATAQVLQVHGYSIQLMLVAQMLAAYGAAAAWLFHSHLVLPVVAPVAAMVVTTLWVSIFNASTERETAEVMTRAAQDLSGQKQKVEADLQTVSGRLQSREKELEQLQEQYRREKLQLENRIHDLRLHTGLGNSLGRLNQPRFAECREHGIVTLEDNVAETFGELERVAPRQSTVLLLGESGTGKELFARALHVLSGRPGRFVPVNLAACPEGLVESELFGHVKGAFTGAVSAKQGLFREADGGTIFLDEIGEIRPDIQVKLLRVLQDREVQPVGSDRLHKVDVRVVSATNKDLHAEVQAGRFRADLFYRLNTITLKLPPLRERPRDIELLAWHFMDRYKNRYGRDVTGISRKAMEALQAHSWPGNVRELENVIERGVTLAEGSVIQEKDLQLDLEAGAEPARQAGQEGDTLQDRDESFLSTLRAHRFEINATAAQLEISRNTVASRFKGICFKRLVDNGHDLEQVARSIAGDTPHYEFVVQKLEEYYQNLVKGVGDHENADAAVAEALKRSRNVPAAYHAAIAELVRKRFREVHPPSEAT